MRTPTFRGSPALASRVLMDMTAALVAAINSVAASDAPSVFQMRAVWRRRALARQSLTVLMIDPPWLRSAPRSCDRRGGASLGRFMLRARFSPPQCM